ncbi:hypothetical protein MUN89_20635 [Halobacillus salinarum]|uniref:Uncharacterized protein n=1 Tax=Halobacillus salinarum TaxID=2932257 RepID=A0ABY4EIB3_9BACI|nr:hypothetical protein [Halobacillus salinarum]UOQ44229.1 hypothetical protein MUN89_20635 [Halobacillus salinarum]
MKPERQDMPVVFYYIFLVPAFLFVYYLFDSFGVFSVIIGRFVDSEALNQEVFLTYNLVYWSISILLTGITASILVFAGYDLYGKFRKSHE